MRVEEDEQFLQETVSLVMSLGEESDDEAWSNHGEGEDDLGSARGHGGGGGANMFNKARRERGKGCAAGPSHFQSESARARRPLPSVVSLPGPRLIRQK